MASPGFSPISEDGEVGEAPQESTPSLPPSAFAAVAAAAAALSAPTLPLSDDADASQLGNAGSGFGLDEPTAETGGTESGAGAWAPPGTVLLLPAAVAPQDVMLQREDSNEYDAAGLNPRGTERFAMEVDTVRPTGAPATSPAGPGVLPPAYHRDSIGTLPDASPSPRHYPCAGDSTAAAAGPEAVGGNSSGLPQPQQKQQPPSSSGLAAGFSTERIAAVLATVDSRQVRRLK